MVQTSITYDFIKSDTIKCVKEILAGYLYAFLTASYIAISNSWCFNDSKANLFLIFALCNTQLLVQEPNVIELPGISDWKVTEPDVLIMRLY